MTTKTYSCPKCGGEVVIMERWQIMRLVAGAMLVCSMMVVALSGCAYLNGDAMWLGKDQKSIRVSNTLLTWFDTEYDIRESNLPFHFVCLPSEDPYEFGCYFETNSVLRICFANRINEANCECVDVRGGAAKVFKRDGTGWSDSATSPGKEREVTNCRSMNVLISPAREYWGVWVYTWDGRSRYMEGVFPKGKFISPQELIVEECENVKFWHQSNWYEW